MASSFEAGVEALKARDYVRAIALLSEAVAADPDDVKARMALGAAFGEVGQWDQAVASLREAVALSPAAPPAQYNLGRALEGAGRIEEAREAYRATARLDPNHDRANAALRRLVDTPLADELAWPTLDEPPSPAAAAGSSWTAPVTPGPASYSPYGGGVPQDVAAPPPPQVRLEAQDVGAVAPPPPPGPGAPPAGPQDRAPVMLGEGMRPPTRSPLLETRTAERQAPPWVNSSMPSIANLLIYLTVLAVVGAIGFGIYNFFVGGSPDNLAVGSAEKAIRTAYEEIKLGLERPDASYLVGYVPNRRQRPVSQVDILEKTQELKRMAIDCEIQIRRIEPKVDHNGPIPIAKEAAATISVTIKANNAIPVTNEGTQVWQNEGGQWSSKSWELFRPIPMFFGSQF